MKDLRTENEELRERVRQLEELLRDPIQPLWNLSLTKTKERMLGILYRTPGVVPRERMDFALHGADSVTDLKCIDVHLSGLGRRLRPHGITIETVWGVGYRLPPESRERIAALIEKQQRGAAAAVKPINGAHQGERHAMDA